MKHIVKKVGQPAEIVDCAITLDYMKEIVGGWIEMCSIGPDVCVVCNEEGMYAGPDGEPLPDNTAGFIGNILVIATEGEGERGMTDEEVRKTLRFLEVLKDLKHSGQPATITAFDNIDELQAHLRGNAQAITTNWENL